MNSKARAERIVVVGGCAAGMSAASKAKRLNPGLEIIALEKTPHVSYSACGIPYYVADLVRDASELVTITPQQFREHRGIDVRTQHEVLAIDPARRLVTAQDLSAAAEIQLEYDRLVMAVGGTPDRPGFLQENAGGVFSLQTLQDGVRVREFVDRERPARVAIIGAGYIGLEMAEAFRMRGIEVEILEKHQRILPALEEAISERICSELRENDVSLHTDIDIKRHEARPGEHLLYLNEISNPIRADFLLVASGLSPNTTLASAANLQLGVTGALRVDWKMQTSDDHIYAAGDCVQVKNLVSGRPDYIPLGPTANKQGRVAGANLGGETATFPGVVGTSVFKTFRLEVAKTGLGCEQAGEFGFDADSVTIEAKSKAGYYPEAASMTIAVVFDKRTRRFLGAQMVGQEGVSKRIDVFATALMNRLSLEDMAYLDLSYAPPFAPVWDPVLVAVNAALGRLK